MKLYAICILLALTGCGKRTIVFRQPPQVYSDTTIARRSLPILIDVIDGMREDRMALIDAFLKKGKATDKQLDVCLKLSDFIQKGYGNMSAAERNAAHTYIIKHMVPLLLTNQKDPTLLFLMIELKMLYAVEVLQSLGG